jgi:hypothetical protein
MGSEEKLDRLLDDVNYKREERAKELYAAAKSLLLEQVEKDSTYQLYRYGIDRYGKYIMERIIGEKLFRFEYHDEKNSYSLNIYVGPKRFLGLKRFFEFFGYNTTNEMFDMTVYKPPYNGIYAVKILKHGDWEETLIKEAEKVRSVGADSDPEIGDGIFIGGDGHVGGESSI